MKHKVFLKNAAILTVTSLILRTVGMFFRIFLSGKIGAEGMGLYQLILSIYVLGATFATSGISTAVTRLVADELVCGTARSVRHILRRSLLLSVLLGLVSAFLIYVCAHPIGAYWIKDVRAVPALKVLAFSLPSMGISSCLRGYFMARREADLPSYAQLLEQAVRIGVIFVLIDRVASWGLAASCVAVIVGDTVAEWISCAHLALGYRRDRRRLERQTAALPSGKPHGSVIRKLIAIAAPITAGRYLNTGLRTIENIMVPLGIAAFCGSREIGLSQFGALKGMALPLIFFPASFLTAISTLLIPELSSAGIRKRHDRIRSAVEKALKITLLSSLLIGTVFTVFSTQLGQLFYDSTEVGIFLRVLAPLAPVMYTESMVDGMLKGLNQQVSSLKYSIADSALRIALIWIVVPRYGMGGFLGIMVVSNLLTSFLNLNRLLTVTGVRFCYGDWLLKPLLCAVGAAGITLGITSTLPWTVTDSFWVLVSAILSVCLLYAVGLRLTGCIKWQELQKIKA